MGAELQDEVLIEHANEKVKKLQKKEKKEKKIANCKSPVSNIKTPTPTLPYVKPDIKMAIQATRVLKSNQTVFKKIVLSSIIRREIRIPTTLPPKQNPFLLELQEHPCVSSFCKVVFFQNV